MKNHMMYSLKGISALAVVLIHITFPGEVGIIIKALARIAVPIFFMVSGYFSYFTTDIDLKPKIKHRIYKNIKLVTITSMVYFLWNIVLLKFNTTNIIHYLKTEFSAFNILRLILTNNSLFSVHLWFIFALIYCYIVLLFVNKYNLYKYAYYSIPVFLAIHISLGEGLSMFGIVFPDSLVRNWLLMGLPFFMLGNLFHKNKERVCVISTKIIISFIIIGSLLSMLSGVFIGVENMYLGSIFISVSLIISAIKYPELLKGKYIEKIGYKYSSFIYLYHLLFAGIFYNIASNIKISDNIIFLCSYPLLVIITSIIGAFLFENIKSYLQQFNFQDSISKN